MQSIQGRVIKLGGIAALGFVGLCFQLAQAQTTDALQYTKNYFVTGDYVVAGVGFANQGAPGVTVTGTINVSGVPSGADIVAAFLYWESEETNQSPSAPNVVFDGNAALGAPRGSASVAACANIGGQQAYARVYRADVLRFLPASTNVTAPVRIANGAHTLAFPNDGITQGMPGAAVPLGASLVVVYRILTPGTPLRAVVIYDGSYTMSGSGGQMNQTLGGFYQTNTTPYAEITHIVGGGKSTFGDKLYVNNSSLATNAFTGAQGPEWDNPTYTFNLGQNQATISTEVTATKSTTCLSWSAIIASMQVEDSDGDGLLDYWESYGVHLNPGTATQPATFGSCQDYPNDTQYPCVNLPAMGANPKVKDIFLEIDWMQGSNPAAHTHQPKFPALSLIAAGFANHGIQIHFDVGNNYQTAGANNTLPNFIVPAKYAQGGQVIPEASLTCPNPAVDWTNCAFPEADYPVLGWKIGFDAIKNGFPTFNIPAYFSNTRKDSFHYVVFGHAVGIPSGLNNGLPASNSGIADLPGGDLMISFGLWSNYVDPANCDVTGINAANQCAHLTGTNFQQAGTLMHELGHNLGLRHAGSYNLPNCEPNYQSVMNYVYQSYLLQDFSGNSHADYSSGELPQLNENSLSENVFQGITLPYQVAYYGPPPLIDGQPVGGATAHCDGTPLDGYSEARALGPLTPPPYNPATSYMDWNNNKMLDAGTYAEDINFNGYTGSSLYDSVQALSSGTPTKWMVDNNDWANLNLPQISARANVGGLSVGVEPNELSLNDPIQDDFGQALLGQALLGQALLGQALLGQEEAGQALLGQALLGESTYEQATSSVNATSSTQPLSVSSSLTGNTLTWGLPDQGVIVQFTIYRSDPNNPTPVIIGTVAGNGSTPPATTFTDSVTAANAASFGPAPTGASGTYYNTAYTYFITATAINNATSVPSNTATGTVDHVFYTAPSPTITYGTAVPALTPTKSGITPPSGLATIPTPTCAASANAPTPAGQVHDAGTYTVACSGDSTPTGAVTYVNGTLTINQAPLTIAAVTNTKTYDGTASAAATNLGVTGLKYSDSVTGLQEAYTTVNAGSGLTLTVTAYTINDGYMGQNYAVSTPNNTSGVIDTKPITTTLTAQNRAYDGTNAEPNGNMSCVLNNVVSTDTLTCTPTAGTFNTTQVTTANTVSATVTFSGTPAGNYTFGASGTTSSVTSKGATASANITTRVLTATLTAQNKTYDGTMTEPNGSMSCTLGNTVMGDVLTCTPSAGTFNTSQVLTANLVTATATFSGTPASNYTLGAGGTTTSVPSGTATANASITTRPVTATLTAQNKVFDGTNAEPNGSMTCSLNNAVAGDGSGCTASAGTFNSSQVVGATTVTATATLSGASASDYTFGAGGTAMSTTSATASASITPAPVTATAGGYSGTYNGVAHAPAACLVTSNAANSFTGTVTCTNNLSTVGPNVGSGSVTPVPAVGGSDSPSNYSITLMNGSWSITPAAVQAAAGSYSGMYDAAPHSPTPACVVTAVYPNTYKGTLSCSNNPATVTNAGSGSVTPTVTGDTLSNYTISSMNGTWNISKATPVIMVTPYSVQYDGNAHMASGLATGIAGVNLSAGLNLTGTVHTEAATYSADPWAFTDATGNYYNAAGVVSDVILQASQTITFNALSNMAYTATPFAVNATTTSPLAVTFTASGACTVTQTGTVTLTNIGTCTITASQAGSTDYAAATPVSQSFTVTTAYTNDSTLADFTTPVTVFGEFTTGTTDAATPITLPYTPTLTNIDNGVRVIGDGSEAPLVVQFPSAVSKIRVFPNIDHYGSSYDGYQYTISGSNDGTNYTMLYNVTSVAGSGEPFTLGAFTGQGPFSVNNVLTAGTGPGGTVGYIADFSFSQAYQYYSFAASTFAVGQGNADQELTAVGALP